MALAVSTTSSSSAAAAAAASSSFFSRLGSSSDAKGVHPFPYSEKKTKQTNVI